MEPRAGPPMRRGLKHCTVPGIPGAARAARAAPYEKGTETGIKQQLRPVWDSRARGPPLGRGTRNELCSTLQLAAIVSPRVNLNGICRPQSTYRCARTTFEYADSPLPLAARTR